MPEEKSIQTVAACFGALAISSLDRAAVRWFYKNQRRIHSDRTRAGKAGPPAWQQDCNRALINAAERNHDLAFELLACGADASYDDSAALSAAARVSSISVAERLLSAGAKATDNQSRCLPEGVRFREMAMVDLLLAHHADPKARESEAMHVAAEANYVAILVRLLDAGADPRARGGQTLTCAAKFACTEAVEILISRATFTKDEIRVAIGGAAPTARQLLCGLYKSRFNSLAATLVRSDGRASG